MHLIWSPEYLSQRFIGESKSKMCLNILMKHSQDIYINDIFIILVATTRRKVQNYLARK